MSGWIEVLCTSLRANLYLGKALHQLCDDPNRKDVLYKHAHIAHSYCTHTHTHTHTHTLKRARTHTNMRLHEESITPKFK